MQGADLARLVLTDEPYNVRIAGHVTGGSHREFAMASGEMSSPQFLAFNLAWMKGGSRAPCRRRVIWHVHRLTRPADRSGGGDGTRPLPDKLDRVG
jgi:hypothetical protein